MLTVQDLAAKGGPMAFVRAAADEAAREEAASWVEVLADCLTDCEASGDADLYARVLLHSWVKQMRRIAGIKPSPEEKRAQTRERVRQHRERKRQGIVLRPRQEPRPPETVASIMADAQRT